MWPECCNQGCSIGRSPSDISCHMCQVLKHRTQILYAADISLITCFLELRPGFTGVPRVRNKIRGAFHTFLGHIQTPRLGLRKGNVGLYTWSLSSNCLWRLAWSGHSWKVLQSVEGGGCGVQISVGAAQLSFVTVELTVGGEAARASQEQKKHLSCDFAQPCILLLAHKLSKATIHFVHLHSTRYNGCEHGNEGWAIELLAKNDPKLQCWRAGRGRGH
jgi:hypothetical protein